MELDVSFTYYDKILAAIAVSLGGGAVAGLLTALRVRLGLLDGALIATVFIYDAVFRNPPLPTASARAMVGAVVWHVFLGVLLLSILP